MSTNATGGCTHSHISINVCMVVYAITYTRRTQAVVPSRDLQEFNGIQLIDLSNSGTWIRQFRNRLTSYLDNRDRGRDQVSDEGRWDGWWSWGRDSELNDILTKGQRSGWGLREGIEGSMRLLVKGVRVVLQKYNERVNWVKEWGTWRKGIGLDRSQKRICKCSQLTRY